MSKFAENKFNKLYEDFRHPHPDVPESSIRMSPREMAFYDKYDSLLSKIFNKYGNVQKKFKGMHPDVVVAVTALKAGDSLPRSFISGFRGPIHMDVLSSLLRQLIRHNIPREKYPEELVTEYLTYASPRNKLYMDILSIFPERNPITNKYKASRAARTQYMAGAELMGYADPSGKN